MPHSSQPTGLVGIGLLGTALAERMLDAGWPIIGFDVSTERRAALQALGGEAVDSAVLVAVHSRKIVLSLPNSDVVESVVAELLPGCAAGTLIIDTTTGDPDRTVEIGARLVEAGVSYVDATVAGSSEQARRGEIIVMAGGTAAAVESCRELLATFAKEVFHVGPCGSGARMKLVVNLVLGLQRAVLAEGLSFARAAGIDPAAALELLKASPAHSKVMETKGPKMLAGDFTPEARLGQHLKDVRLILELGERVNAGLPLSELHRQLLERAVELGYGEADNSAIFKAFERGTA
jgi:3-hydroxyisobutyrate dehydrogenase-like beta-hydroxyacid dehydrogenase